MEQRKRRSLTWWVGAVSAVPLLVAGCATQPPADDPDAVAAYDEVNDAAEPTNRVIFNVNDGVDTVAIKPAAKGYRWSIPDGGRRGVANFLDNLRSPINLANDLLQGKPTRARDTVARFIINSTLGVAGFFDFAGDQGIKGHREDFGQTLAVWGVGEGGHVVLPLLGPSSPRDATGLVVDVFLDPLTYLAPTWLLVSRAVVRGIDEREEVLDTLEEIKSTSIDYYATIRSLYRQRREDQIRDGAPPPVIPLPGLSLEEREGIPEIEIGGDVDEDDDEEEKADDDKDDDDEGGWFSNLLN